MALIGVYADWEGLDGPERLVIYTVAALGRVRYLSLSTIKGACRSFT